MPKRLIESTLTTKAARGALLPGVHWRGIDREVHLGYNKGRRGGRWLVRWYQPSTRKYQRIDLGDADDVLVEGTLDYHAAVSAAKDAVQKARRKAVADAAGPVLTVGHAVNTYIAVRNARRCTIEAREVKADADSTLRKHVLSHTALCEKRLDEMTETDLESWRLLIDPNLKGTTRRRILNDFKAALNATFRKERRRLPAELGEMIKVGLAAEAIGTEIADVARENQILEDDIVRRIIATAFEIDGDLGNMVLVLAATGARFSQLRRMKVRDAQLLMQRLLVPKSHKGRNKQLGYTAIRIGADVVAALGRAIAGRKADEPLFLRWRHKQIGARHLGARIPGSVVNVIRDHPSMDANLRSAWFDRHRSLRSSSLVDRKGDRFGAADPASGGDARHERIHDRETLFTLDRRWS
jgi:integrase